MVSLLVVQNAGGGSPLMCQKTEDTLRFDHWLPRRCLISMKLGWVTSYSGSVMLTSCINIMSAVAPALVSRALMTVALRFALWVMIHMVPTRGLYLFMSGYGTVFVGGLGSVHCRSGFLPGIADSLILDGTFRVKGCVGYIRVSSHDAVDALECHVGAGLSTSAWALWAVMLVSGMVACAEATYGASIVGTGAVVVAELLAMSALISGARVEVRRYFSGFI
jgi:hypothetical protein